MPRSTERTYPDRTCGEGRFMACVPARARTSATLELDRAMRGVRRCSRISAIPRVIFRDFMTGSEGVSLGG